MPVLQNSTCRQTCPHRLSVRISSCISSAASFMHRAADVLTSIPTGLKAFELLTDMFRKYSCRSVTSRGSERPRCRYLSPTYRRLYLMGYSSSAVCGKWLLCSFYREDSTLNVISHHRYLDCYPERAPRSQRDLGIHEVVHPRRPRSGLQKNSST